MSKAPQPTRAAARGALATLAAAATLLVLLTATSGCGSNSDAAPPGLTIAGPGLRTSQPPWKPEYLHLHQRLKEIGIPPGGHENFHIHAMLHVYVNGLLQPVPAEIGIEASKGFETSLHTHDSTGIIHMEARHPYPFTLGDFFAVWGVKLGPAQVGGLTGLGGDRLHFYLNGKPLANPAAHVLKNGDSIVIGYGPDSSFPHTPSTYLLYEVEHGLGGLGCSPVHKGKGGKACAVPKPTPAEKAAANGATKS
jgi:hypothetical protein